MKSLYEDKRLQIAKSVPAGTNGLRFSIYEKLACKTLLKYRQALQ
jgi:hypothetical protein